MKIWVNGELRDLEGARSINDLIKALALPAAAVLVEHNAQALRREEWNERTLADGDRIEILRIAAGG